jgi:hypothetical protein
MSVLHLQSVSDVPCGDYEWPTAYVGNGDEGDEHVASVT